MDNNNQTVVINNYGIPGVKLVNKWTAFVLCIFLGYLGAHRFYEGKAILGIIYLFTFGLFGIGWFIDIIRILCKPNPYAVVQLIVVTGAALNQYLIVLNMLMKVKRAERVSALFSQKKRERISPFPQKYTFVFKIRFLLHISQRSDY